MEDQNQLSSSPEQESSPTPGSSVSGLKIVQPPQSLVEEEQNQQQSPSSPTVTNGARERTNTRIDAAVQALKQCKAQGLAYYDASQTLAKQGFSQGEIEQASTQFIYSDATAPNVGSTPQETSLDQEFAEAATKDKVEDITRQALQKDMLLGFLGGRSAAGRYYGAKVVRDYAALKDLEQTDKTGQSNPNNPSQLGTRVYQRHRIVKYYAMLALVPIIFAVLNLLATMAGALKSVGAGQGHGGLQLNDINLYIGPLIICAVCGSIAALLLLARKESTITRAIYMLLGFDLLVFLAFALIFRSLTFVIIGLLTVLPGYWISRRVGLLSQLN